MQSFYDRYKVWPEYPVGDAGYGSYNNYLFCEEHGMKKYMKFSMFKKETTDMNYHSDPFRSVNFKIDFDQREKNIFSSCLFVIPCLWG